MSNKDRKVVYSTETPAETDSPFASLRDKVAPDAFPPPAPVKAGPPARPDPSVPGAAVRVQRERKGRRGKTVSVVSGVPGPEARRQELLKSLKQRLGAGGALEGEAIVIQGDHRDRIVELLNQMGYRAKPAGG
jgi:translation initiation factor 1